MKRRDFLKRTTPAVTLPLLLGGFNIHALGKSNLLNVLNTSEESDRVLVLVQLNGGNDGLNTIIPLDYYPNLFKARQNIIIPENKIIRLESEPTGFHPSMQSIKNLWDDKKIGIVQNVGYPNPNFSHFRSTDIITSASDSNELINTGWVGRYLNEENSGYPEGYPNEENPDPLAITVGSFVSTTCQGPITNMGVAINDVEALFSPVGGDPGQLPNNPYGNELGFIRETQLQTQLYLDSVSNAASKAFNKSPLYPSRDSLAQQLKVVARLVAGGLKTKIYVVNIGSFDTHANQVDTSGNEIGSHANLLSSLSESIAAFQDDLFRLGIEDRVAGMTFTEFGRRVKSNNSAGSDHGTSWPLMLFGSWVKPEIHGKNPIIPSQVAQSYNLPHTFDFRSIYGSVLKDWLKVPEATIRNILFDDFNYLPLFRDSLVTGLEDPRVDSADLINYPNPANERTQISFRSMGGHTDLTVYTITGQKVSTLIDKQIPKGAHSLLYETKNLKQGIYLIKIRNNGKLSSRKMMVTH